MIEEPVSAEAPVSEATDSMPGETPEGRMPVDHRIVPSVGRIVHYQMTSYDCTMLKEQRASLELKTDPKSIGGFSTKLAAEGNGYKEGEIVAAVIVRTWGDSVESSCNLQLLLDGNDSMWKTSVSQTSHPDNAPEFGRWSVPPRA
jgi:hypothetical protein